MNPVQFSVSNDWGAGFTAGLTVTNTGTQPLSGWTLEFESSFTITQIWNAEIIQQEGNRYVVRNVSWNAAIAPGKTISFGFNGSKNGGSAVAVSRLAFDGSPVTPTPTPTPPPPPPTPPTPVLPTVSIGDVTLTEGDSETKNAVFEVKLSQPSTKSVTVDVATTSGTAEADGDYVATASTITFAPGSMTQTVSVSVIGDTVVESDETFLVSLSNPVNATLSDRQGVATLINDDVLKDNVPPEILPSPSKSFNYGEALQKSFLFYEAQRSGDLPATNRIAWRGDSSLKDGADVGRDLSGGYHEAGNHVKFNFPLASSMTLLGWGVVEFRGAYQQSGQLDEALDAIKWGTDYLMKCHVVDSDGKTLEFWGQVGTGGLDHLYWGPPEKMKMARPAYKIDRQNPGSDLAGEAAAALAAAAIAFRPTDAAYADQLLQHAEQLFEFADTYRGKYSDSIPQAKSYYNSGGYIDELVWAATWLYKATGKTSYLNQAESNYYGITANWTHNWDLKDQGATVLLAQLTGKEMYRNHAERWLDYWTNANDNGIQTTPGGLAWLTKWGSLRYSANTAMIAGIYSDTVADEGDRYANFAESQIDYILGDNPRDFSYMVGFGDNFPLQPHHRSASGTSPKSIEPNRNILYGALVGGLTEADDFAYQDKRSDYVSNEVTLDYNAGLTGALAWMYKNFGGEPLSLQQLDSLPGITIT